MLLLPQIGVVCLSSCVPWGVNCLEPCFVFTGSQSLCPCSHPRSWHVSLAAGQPRQLSWCLFVSLPQLHGVWQHFLCHGAGAATSGARSGQGPRSLLSGVLSCRGAPGRGLGSAGGCVLFGNTHDLCGKAPRARETQE